MGNKIHFEVRNKETFLPLTDCLCKKVPFPELTRDWDKVTCKYCLKLKCFTRQKIETKQDSLKPY